MKKVVLVGYMGSGKSLISKLLAQKMHFSFLELDEIIQEEAQMSIQTIFEKKGELYFRKLEHQLFVQNMNINSSFVMSTGGGTPCYFNNHEWLQSENCISIYLKASLETLVKRLKDNTSNRPLLTKLNEDEMHEFVAKHLFERSYFYHQAKFIVEVDDKSPEAIVDEIINLL